MMEYKNEFLLHGEARSSATLGGVLLLRIGAIGKRASIKNTLHIRVSPECNLPLDNAIKKGDVLLVSGRIIPETHSYIGATALEATAISRDDGGE